MFYHIVSIEHSSLLRINNIGCSSDPENNRFGPGVRSIYLIHYVVKGKGYFNGKPVTAGQGFLITQGQLEEYYPDKSDPWEFLWVTSDDDRIEALYEYYNADKASQIFTFSDIFTIKRTMQFIKNNHNLIVSVSEILECFLHIFNRHAHTVKKNPLNADVYFEFSLNYIKSNLHNAIAVKALVDTLGISATYLLKIFKARAGISPKQYISRLRITNAKRLLTQTNMTVTQIASSVGYGDVLSFSRFFRTKTGLSPLKYRALASSSEL